MVSINLIHLFFSRGHAESRTEIKKNSVSIPDKKNRCLFFLKKIQQAHTPNHFSEICIALDTSLASVALQARVFENLVHATGAEIGLLEISVGSGRQNPTGFNIKAGGGGQGCIVGFKVFRIFKKKSCSLLHKQRMGERSKRLECINVQWVGNSELHS